MKASKHTEKEDEEEQKKDVLRAGVDNEETPVITFQYDLDEVYGNPAAVTADEEYDFHSETEFS